MQLDGVLKQSHPGFLSHERLDQVIFQDPFQPGLLYDSVNTFSNFRDSQFEDTDT